MEYNNFLQKRLKIALPLWTVFFPIIGIVLLLLPYGTDSALYAGLLGLVLMVIVVSAVHHAEVVAHKVGEPFGTIILALAITVLEVSLIVSIMLTEGEKASALARDTVFAAIMLILTGIIGLCLLVGGARFKEQQFVKQGVNASLVALTAIVLLTLVLPNYTTSEVGPVYSTSQLIFVAIISLVLYGGFIAVQTVRHRDYFLPAKEDGASIEHAEPPTKITAITSLIFLLLALAAVVLLSKKLSPNIEAMVDGIGAPQSLVGIIIAAVILFPEGLAAIRAARKNRLQTSLNLALGSALASIGLSIPAVAIVAYFSDFTITLGIDTKSTLLVMLSLFTISLSFGAGRTNILQGIVLLVILATYLFTTIVP